MKMSRELAYGLRVVILLGQRPEEVAVADIAMRHGTSPGYLSKIIAALVREGIVVPTGTNLVALARDPKDISIADVVSAYGPPFDVQRCLLRHETLHPCERFESCKLCKLWEDMQAELLEVMGRYSLAEFAKQADTFDEAGADDDAQRPETDGA